MALGGNGEVLWRSSYCWRRHDRDPQPGLFLEASHTSVLPNQILPQASGSLSIPLAKVIRERQRHNGAVLELAAILSLGWLAHFSG